MIQGSTIWSIVKAAVVAVTMMLGMQSTAHAESLTTTFAGGNGQSGNMFDVVVKSKPIRIKSLVLHVDGGGLFEIYTRPGTHQAGLNSPAGWTLIATTTLASGQVAWDIPDIELPAGSTTGFYVTGSTGSVRYTNGTALGAVAAEDANLQILQGRGVVYAFSGTFTPRIWNGTINYEIATPTVSTAPRTVNAIGRFLSARNNQLLSNGPDAGRQVDRLMEADGAPGTGTQPSAGFSRPVHADMVATADQQTATAAAARVSGAHEHALARASTMPDSGGRQSGGSIFNSAVGPFGGIGFPGHGFQRSGLGLGSSMWPSETVSNGAAVQMGGLRFQGSNYGPLNFGFSTSLRDMTRAAEAADADKRAAAGFSPGAQGSPRSARPAAFDIWAEGRYASFKDDRASFDNDGHFGLFSVGADFVLNRSLLVGTMVQFDSMQQRSERNSNDVRGHGWMAGPYATIRLTNNIFWQARAAWGKSSNHISPFLTYTDHFDSERWLASTSLTGVWRHAAWMFKPSATLSWIEDVSEGYTDSTGTLIPQVKTHLGQFKLGPEISYRFDHGTTRIEPRMGAQLIHNFSQSVKADGFGSLQGEGVGPEGTRGRVEAGVRATSADGLVLDLSGAYDGIGSSSYNAVSGRAVLRIPLN